MNQILNQFDAGTIMVIIMITVIVLAYTFHYIRDKRRSEELEKIAQSYGWQYKRMGSIKSPRKLAFIGRSMMYGYDLHRPTIKNMITGQISPQLKIQLFDMKLRSTAAGTYGSFGRGKVSFLITYCLITFEGLSVPDFHLIPENKVIKIASKFGLKDINFEQSPDFSDKYYLRGKDEAQIRQFFTPALLNYIATHSKLTTIGSENQIAVTQSKKLKPEELKSFIEDMRQLAEVFSNQQKTPSI